MSAEVVPEVLRSYRTLVRLDADPSKAEPHPGTGGLIVWGTARTVGVLDYPDLSPPTSELVDEETLFDAASMATAIGVPLTIDHPPMAVDDGLVTPDTVRDLAHGWIVEVARRDSDLRVRVVLASRAALDAYAAGVRELSMAYRSRSIPEAGEWNGKPYTAKQTPAVYNAIAQVPLARAGHTARLDAKPRGTMKITIAKTTITDRDIPAFVADSITAQATAHKAAADKGVRADAIEVGTIAIDGTELTLPKAMIDQIIAMLGGTAAAPASASEPEVEMDADTTKDPDASSDPNAEKDPARMDSKTLQNLIDSAVAKAVANVPKLVDAQVQTRLDAQRSHARVVALAAPLLGDRFPADGLDEYEVAAQALIRHDSASRDDVTRLAAAARGGDARAAGRLEQRLEDAVRSRQEADTSGELGLSIDLARQDAAANAGEQPVNRTEAARLKSASRGLATRPGARA